MRREPQGVSLAAQLIKAWKGDIMIAEGWGKLSRLPTILPKVRWGGSRIGNARLVDQLVSVDPISAIYLESRENVCRTYKNFP